MSEIIYHPGTIDPDAKVGLCGAHNAQYAAEGVESLIKWDASNPTPPPPPATENKKRKRGRPRTGQGPHDVPLAVTENLVVTPAAQHVEGAAAPATVMHTTTLPPALVDDGLAIPKMPVVLAFTTEAKEEAEATIGMLREVQLKTPEHESWAMNAANALAKKHDELEKKRKSWTAPLKKVTSDIESEFRPVLQLLTQGIDILKQKVGDYRFALEQEKRQALAAMQTAVQAGNVAQAQALATQIEIAAPPPPDKGSVKMVWTGQVTDPTAIPREYLVPDVNALLAMTASLKRDPQIPGWKAWEVPDVKISRR
jgi:hypothetical protein